MDNLAKPTNRALFLVSVAVTGAFAGAAVWLFFFAMEHGIDYLWTEIPHALGVASPELASGPFGFLPYPFFVCLLGGLLIGLYEKITGTKTDDLNQVMVKVKQDGRYPYDNLGKLSLAALLPLLSFRVLSTCSKLELCEALAAISALETDWERTWAKLASATILASPVITWGATAAA